MADTNEDSTYPEASAKPMWPANRLIVSIQRHGLEVPTFTNAAPIGLGAPELILLDELNRPGGATRAEAVESAATGAALGRDDRERLEQLFDRLEKDGWISPEPSEVLDRAPAGPAPRPTRRPAPALSDSAAISTPWSVRPVPGGYEFVGHLGDRLAAVSSRELLAMGELTEPVTIGAALDRHRERAGSFALAGEEFLDVIGRLAGAGVVAFGPSDDLHGFRRVRVEGLDDSFAERDRICQEVFTRFADADDAEESEREARTGVVRPQVVPVAFDPVPPLALALITAYGKIFDDGRLGEHYRFRREWVWLEDRFEQHTSRPAVYMFSNYLWSHAQCIEISRRVKAANPASITIHGGPDTPKYEGDARAYFAANPHVDVTVRGEGEQTAVEVLRALMDVIGNEHPDLSVLADVPGIYFRAPDGTVHCTADRDRMTDLDILPSPFLTGLFDAYAEIPGTNITMETNRGCPYGCTFCDWGSATLSRIRKFDLQRVYDEIEWCAKSHMQAIGPADSNFGIFERDVPIAEFVAQMKEKHGYPRYFGVSYAKNTVKHLQHIIQTIANAGIVVQGILSLQTMDEDTLSAVHRSNIKTEKYDLLAGEMRRADLPLFVDLMQGLPGSTRESFTRDLQQCIEREVQVRIPQTTLLVNSPMNDPEYRAEHKIEVHQPLAPGRPALVVSTATFTRQDYFEMSAQRRLFLLFENFGVMRQVSRFVRQETGTLETDLYERMRLTSRRRSEPVAADPDPDQPRAARDGATRQLGSRLRGGASVPRLGDRRRRRLRARHRAPRPARARAQPRPGAPGDARAHPRLRGLVPRHARGEGVARSRPVDRARPPARRVRAGAVHDRRSGRGRTRRDRGQHRAARLRVELGVRDADPPRVHRQGADRLRPRGRLGVPGRDVGDGRRLI